MVAGLALGRSASEVAELARVTEETVAKRVSDSAFTARVADRREFQARTAGSVTARQAPLMEVTKQQLVYLPGARRLATARMVLDWSLRFLEGEELTDRVAELHPSLGYNPTGHCPTSPIS